MNDRYNTSQYNNRYNNRNNQNRDNNYKRNNSRYGDNQIRYSNRNQSGYREDRNNRDIRNTYNVDRNSDNGNNRRYTTPPNTDYVRASELQCLVTKEDIENLRTDIAHLDEKMEAEIANIRTDIANLDKKMEVEITKLPTKEELKYYLTRKDLYLAIGIATGFISLVIIILAFLHV